MGMRLMSSSQPSKIEALELYDMGISITDYIQHASPRSPEYGSNLSTPITKASCIRDSLFISRNPHASLRASLTLPMPLHPLSNHPRQIPPPHINLRIPLLIVRTQKPQRQ